jgi:soluble lytic murein transglycosylase-like protein
VRASLQAAIADRAVPTLNFSSGSDNAHKWLYEMSRRLQSRIPDRKERIELLKTVHYEAIRNGLDPQLVLGLIQVESGFRKYATSSAGARGYMQVMPFWVRTIGERHHNLFALRTNLRYGCVILRHYLDRENGDYFRALGRYNGSLGRREYPDAVRAHWQGTWKYDGATS